MRLEDSFKDTSRYYRKGYELVVIPILQIMEQISEKLLIWMKSHN